MLRERMVTLADATDLAAPLLNDVQLTDDIVFPPAGVDVQTAQRLLDATADAVRDGLLGDSTELRDRLRSAIEGMDVKPRIAFRALYVAILGVPAGLPVFDSMAFLGAEETLRRLDVARARLHEQGALASEG